MSSALKCSRSRNLEGKAVLFWASRRSSPSRHCPSSCLSGSCSAGRPCLPTSFGNACAGIASLDRNEESVRTVWDCVKSFLQHGSDHTEHRMLRDRVAYKILAAQIENWRQVQLLAEQGELCHVSDPFLVWLLSIEVPIQEIRSNPSNFALVGTVLLHPHLAC